MASAVSASLASVWHQTETRPKVPTPNLRHSIDWQQSPLRLETIDEEARSTAASLVGVKSVARIHREARSPSGGVARAFARLPTLTSSACPLPAHRRPCSIPHGNINNAWPVRLAGLARRGRPTRPVLLARTAVASCFHLQNPIPTLQRQVAGRSRVRQCVR